MFSIPIGATGHIGVQTAGQVMPLLMNKLQFFGGALGYSAVALQIRLKNWYFKSMLAHTGVVPTNPPASQQRCTAWFYY
jgi:hypothetical protein